MYTPMCIRVHTQHAYTYAYLHTHYTHRIDFVFCNSAVDLEEKVTNEVAIITQNVLNRSQQSEEQQQQQQQQQPQQQQPQQQQPQKQHNPPLLLKQ